jgi:hypothetical protein
MAAITAHWKILATFAQRQFDLSKPKTLCAATFSILFISCGTKNALFVPGLSQGSWNVIPLPLFEVLPCLEAHCFAHLL